MVLCRHRRALRCVRLWPAAQPASRSAGSEVERRVRQDGTALRSNAVLSLEESQREGDTPLEALRRLSKRLDMGVPAARSVRDYLIRNGHWKGEA